jgi:AhpD family alkylhydroperoxidase
MLQDRAFAVDVTPPGFSRAWFERFAPDAQRALTGLEAALWLDPTVRDLVGLRTAQLNGCADRLDRFVRMALELGESPRRLAELSGWRHSPQFDPRERAALELAEALALLPGDGALAEARREAARYFEPHELAMLVFACVVANAEDRLELALGGR